MHSFLLARVVFASLSTTSSGLTTATPEADRTEAPVIAPAIGPEPGVGSRFRFHSEVQFAGFTHVNPNTESSSADPTGGLVPGAGLDAFPTPVGTPAGTFAGDENINSWGVGVGRLREVDEALPLWSVGFGYAIMPRRALLGLRTGFRLDGSRGDDSDIGHRFFGTKVVPYFRYLFGTIRGSLTPYAEARFGFVGTRSTVRIRGEGGSVSRVASIGPVFGLEGGLHIPIVPRLSFDVGFGFDYQVPFARTTTKTDDTQVRSDWRKSADVLDLGVHGGLSLWFT